MTALAVLAAARRAVAGLLGLFRYRATWYVAAALVLTLVVYQYVVPKYHAWRTTRAVDAVVAPITRRADSAALEEAAAKAEAARRGAAAKRALREAKEAAARNAEAARDVEELTRRRAALPHPRTLDEAVASLRARGY